MQTTRRKFFSLLATGAALIVTPLRAFSKTRETETVTAKVHRRIMDTGGDYLFIATQVRKFKAGQLVKVTIEKV